MLTRKVSVVQCHHFGGRGRAFDGVRWAYREYSPGKSDSPITSSMEEVRLGIGVSLLTCHRRKQPPWPHRLAEERLMSCNGL